MTKLNCAVLTVSNKHTAANDTAGDYLVDQLQRAGHQCTERTISPSDLYQLRKIVSAWIADPHIHIIITNGGTGYGPNKHTTAAIAPLLDQQVVGFGELFRQLSFEDIGSSAMQSNAIAGLANNKAIFCIPGSVNACRLAWTRLIREQLNPDHTPCNFVAHCTSAS